MKSALINIWFSENFPDYFDFFCKSCEINENNFDWYIFTNLTNSKKNIKKNIFFDDVFSIYLVGFHEHGEFYRFLQLICWFDGRFQI